MPVTITRVDPRAEEQLRAWWQAGSDTAAQRPFPAYAAWDQARAVLALERTDARLELFAAYDGRQVVGGGMAVLRLLDNPMLCVGEVFVPPEFRRRGVGTALHAELERVAREAGRTRLMVSAPTPPDSESAAVICARLAGYRRGNEESAKFADLAATEHTWAALRCAADAHRGDYTFAVWRGPTPEEYLEAAADLRSGFMSQVPSGDLDLEDSPWTPERVREADARAVAGGRDSLTVVAVRPDGSLAGVSELTVSEADPRQGEIGRTLVLTADRGHRLGMGLKVRLHQELRAAYPQAEVVCTENADTNGPMNRINEALGYRVMERIIEMQKDL